jgi:hypothetical protein
MNSAPYSQPVMLDSQAHRQKRLRLGLDVSVTKDMHVCFLGVSEFPQASADFPIIFLDTGDKDEAGRMLMTPAVVFGLTQGENLMLEGDAWQARYVPAYIRRFPFFSAAVDQEGGQGVFVETTWSGFSDTEGERLFDDEGQATEVLQGAIDFMKRFDDEVERTRRFCVRLMELDLLESMTANLTLADGSFMALNGFYTVKDTKLAELPDATVLEMHKNGMLMMLHAHMISLGQMRHLADRKSKRLAAATGTTPKESPAA